MCVWNNFFSPTNTTNILVRALQAAENRTRAEKDTHKLLAKLKRSECERERLLSDVLVLNSSFCE